MLPRIHQFALVAIWSCMICHLEPSSCYNLVTKMDVINLHTSQQVKTGIWNILRIKYNICAIYIHTEHLYTC